MKDGSGMGELKAPQRRVVRSNVVAFIPARQGSKGLPLKNIRVLDGKPLYHHAVSLAEECGISDIYVSTDIPEILDQKEANFKGVRRPDSLAGDHVVMGEVLHDFVKEFIEDPCTILLLQPTSPLRTRESVQEALTLYKQGDHSIVMSVTKTDNAFLKYGFLQDGHFVPVSKPAFCFSNRQSLPATYRPNGAVYVFDSEMFRNSNQFSAERIGAVLMGELESIDIDSEADFAECEAYLSKRRTK